MTRQSGVRAYLGTALFSLAAATLVALVISELARPQPLLISGDAPGYLMPSISALSGQGFGHTHGRGFVYPLVVYGSILGSGDLSGIISIQVVLYWLMLVMLVSLIWIRVNSNPQAQRPTGSIILLTLVSLSLAITYLSYSPTAITVYSLRPELVYGFLAVLSSIALIWAFAQRKRAGALFVAAMCISIFATMANVVAKPQWIFGAAFISVVWLGVLAVSCMRIWSKIGVLVSMAIVVIITLLLPEQRLIEKYDPWWGVLFGPKTLFCNHADIIVRAAQNRPELWAHFPTDFTRQALDNLKAVLAEPEGWPLLGFNGDRCMYGDAFAALVNNFHANDVPSIRNFYTTMFVNSVLTEPALYLRKVSAQMADASLRPFWNAGAVAHATDSEARELTSAHKQYADLFAVPMNGSILGVMARYSPRIDRFMATLTERVLDRLALIAVCAALLCWWLVRSMGRPISATPALAIVVLTGAWLGQALTVALSHTFDVGRYFWASAPLLMGATFLAFSLLTQIIPAFRAR